MNTNESKNILQLVKGVINLWNQLKEKQEVINIPQIRSRYSRKSNQSMRVMSRRSLERQVRQSLQQKEIPGWAEELKKDLKVEDSDAMMIVNFIANHKLQVDNLPLGKGGHAIVFKGIDFNEDKVAIKALKCENEDQLKGNLNEFEAMRKCQAISRHVVTAKELLLFQSRSCCLHFIIMERCKIDLKQILLDKIANNTWINRKQVHEISLQLIAGLKEIHKANVIHLDVKPGNILLSYENVWKFTDLGISKNLQGQQDHTINLKGMTARYSSPEQYQAHSFETQKRITKQSDIYSLGVVLLELTGVNVKEKWVLKQKLRQKPFDKYLNPEFNQFNERVIKPMLRYAPHSRIPLEEAESNVADLISKENQDSPKATSTSKSKLTKESLRQALFDQAYSKNNRANSLENIISQQVQQQQPQQQSQQQSQQQPQQPQQQQQQQQSQQIQQSQGQSGYDQERVSLKTYLMKKMASLNLLPNQSNQPNASPNVNINPFLINNNNNNQSINGNSNSNNNYNLTTNATNNGINSNANSSINLYSSNYNSPSNVKGNFNIFSSSNNNSHHVNNITPRSNSIPNVSSLVYQSNVSPTHNNLSYNSLLNNNLFQTNNVNSNNNNNNNSYKGEYGLQPGLLSPSNNNNNNNASQQLLNSKGSQKKRSSQDQVGSAKARVSNLLGVSTRMGSFQSLLSPTAREMSPLKKRVSSFHNSTNNNSFFQNHNAILNSKQEKPLNSYNLEKANQNATNNQNSSNSKKGMRVYNSISGNLGTGSPINFFQINTNNGNNNNNNNMGNSNNSCYNNQQGMNSNNNMSSNNKLTSPQKAQNLGPEVESLFHRIPNTYGKFYPTQNTKLMTQATQSSVAIPTGTSIGMSSVMNDKMRSSKNVSSIETKIFKTSDNKYDHEKKESEIYPEVIESQLHGQQKQQKSQLQQMQLLLQQPSLAFTKQQHQNLTNVDMNQFGRSPSASGGWRQKLSLEQNSQSPKRAKGQQPPPKQQGMINALGKIQVRNLSQQMIYKKSIVPQSGQALAESPSVSLSIVA